jgi:hypothetical protein
MTDNYIVVQFHTRTNQRFVHNIHISTERSYQQICSLDAFHRGRKSLTEKRNRNNGFIYMARFADEFEVDCQFQDYSVVPRIHHDSAWDYYNSIGYDWKNKRWI